MTLERRQPLAFAQEVTTVYHSLVRSVRAREQCHHPTHPYSDRQTVTERLWLPLTLWEADRKPTRTVPALIAYDAHLDTDERRRVEPLLVGLDVFVTMLDEFIDTPNADSESRLELATNVAFASLLSFTNVPEEAESKVVDCLFDYLVDAARIPATEQSVQRALRTAKNKDRAREVRQDSYAHRATDISVFGRLPALVAEVDDSVAASIVHDLETYRAHYLMFDDLRDVAEDRVNGTETPVSWLLQTHSDPEVIFDKLAETYAAFEYTERSYTQTLRRLEREPADVRTDIMSAVNGRLDQPETRQNK